MDFSWEHVARIRKGHTKRASSWDRTGANSDWINIPAGETGVLAEIEGPGMIKHFYFTMIMPDFLDYRDAVVRMFWDGEDTPSVEVLFGDFFCIGNCVVRYFSSHLVTVNPGNGDPGFNTAGNCYFPMPFSKGARIEIENQSNRMLGGLPRNLWYHIDYDAYDEPMPDDIGRFHAQWRRENPTVPVKPSREEARLWTHQNLTGDDNYVMLEAEGEGHIAGLFLQVDNINGGWYGEGDDMIDAS